MCHTRRIHREILFQCSDPEALQFNVSAEKKKKVLFFYYLTGLIFFSFFVLFF